MGSSPPAPPPAPDPRTTAAAQTGSNVFSAMANQYGGMVGLKTPYGTTDYSQTDQKTFTDPNSGQTYDVPQYTQNVGLTPEGQRLLQNTVGTQDIAGQQARTLLGNANYGAVPDSVGDATTGLTKTLIDQNVSYMQPLQQQAEDRLETQLRNQGNLPGSEAYTRAKRDLGDQQARDRNQMIIGSQGTAFNEAQSNYLRPLQVAQGLFPLGTPAQPSQVQTPASGYAQPATNYAGIVNNAYQGQMAGYNAQLGAYGARNSMISGLASPLASIFTAGMMR